MRAARVVGVDVVVDEDALLVRHDDLGCGGGPDVGVEHPDDRECQEPAHELRDDEPRYRRGRDAREGVREDAPDADRRVGEAC
jgi:hypothetical protein